MTPAGLRLANGAQLSSMRVRTIIGVLVAAAMLALAAGPPQAAPRTPTHPPHDHSVGPRSAEYTHMPTPFSDRL